MNCLHLRLGIYNSVEYDKNNGEIQHFKHKKIEYGGMNVGLSDFVFALRHNQVEYECDSQRRMHR